MGRSYEARAKVAVEEGSWLELAWANVANENFLDLIYQAATENDGLYPYVVANLTADILAQLSIPLSAVCRRHLVLGGIVEKRAQKVEEAYTRAGGKIIARVQENDWVAYHFLFEKTLA